jgi:hypothetical protein
MSEAKEHKGYRVGQKVICILNNRSNLTVGKEYIIDSIDCYEDSDDFWLNINNNDGMLVSYHYSRFIDKADFRKHIIDDILK